MSNFETIKHDALQLPMDQRIALIDFLREGLPVSRHKLNGNHAIESAETPYEKAKRFRLIGAAKNLPPDLSTNPTHMEGFGKP